MRRYLIPFVCLAMAGCSSSNKPIPASGAVVPAAPASPTGGGFAGVWTGSLVSTAGVTTSASGLILPNGGISLLCGNGALVAGLVQATGSSAADEAFAGEGTLYTASGVFDPLSLSYLTLSGAFGGTTGISGTFTGLGATGLGTGGTFTLAADPNAPSSYVPNLTTLAGPYLSSSNVDQVLNLFASGGFTGSDQTGRFTGTLAVVGAGLNALTATVDYTPTGATQPIVYTGVAYVDSTLNPLAITILASNPAMGQWAVRFVLNAGS